MSEINVEVVPVEAISRETIKKSLETLLKLTRGISSLTPSNLDDKIVDIASKFATEEWFIDLVELVVGLFDKNEEAQARVALENAVAALKASRV